MLSGNGSNYFAQDFAFQILKNVEIKSFLVKRRKIIFQFYLHTKQKKISLYY